MGFRSVLAGNVSSAKIRPWASVSAAAAPAPTTRTSDTCPLLFRERLLRESTFRIRPHQRFTFGLRRKPPSAFIPFRLQQLHRNSSHCDILHEFSRSAYRVPGQPLTALLQVSLMRGRAPPQMAAKKKPGSSFEEPGYRPGNNLLSRDLTSYYHWRLRA